MSSDETYLESFLESLSGLPNEIKRNLELMKDLDKSCSYVSAFGVALTIRLYYVEILYGTAFTSPHLTYSNLCFCADVYLFERILDQFKRV